jgi:thymidylate synthase (FAD)
MDKLILSQMEEYYNTKIKLGQTPQQARYWLPNGLKTEIIATTNLREWRHILKLRTAPAAHPQMRELMLPLLAEFKEKLPAIFGDINEK